jgi:hypothetical protein
MVPALEADTVMASVGLQRLGMLSFWMEISGRQVHHHGRVMVQALELDLPMGVVPGLRDW